MFILLLALVLSIFNIFFVEENYATHYINVLTHVYIYANIYKLNNKRKNANLG